MSFERPQHLNLKRREKRLGHTLCPLQVSLGLLGEALEVGCLCGQCPYLVGHISAVLRPWAFFFFFYSSLEECKYVVNDLLFPVFTASMPFCISSLVSDSFP